eukprot:TRINITY_DN4542_c0_g2_i1.p1 TRINITY_DN4542_c0_g2~~TRINITY_DN4542_c0_g2_i1.p1  ORF type:complete len:380 (+),score=54.06 TRINITY_DN4542_c0_g2_i1:49-1188(+)
MSRDYSSIPPPPMEKFERAEKFRYDTTIKEPRYLENPTFFSSFFFFFVTPPPPPLPSFPSYSRRWQREDTIVCWTPQPVGKGGMRDCYLVWEADENLGRPTQMIGKVFQQDVKATLEDYMNEAITQCVADTFAQAYNKQGVEHKVSFLACYVVIMSKRGPNGEKTVFTMEPMLRGIYEKHNNNVGQTFTDNPTADAFSHFTYGHSGNKLLVCDLQGVGGMYTDPQIHSLSSGDEFGLGNLGAEGIRKWVASHKCGPLCTAMDLQPFSHTPSPARRGAAPKAPPPRSGGPVPPPQLGPQIPINHNQMVQEMANTFRRASSHHHIQRQPTVPAGQQHQAERVSSERDIDKAIKESLMLEQRRNLLEQELLKKVMTLSLQET